MNCRYLRHSSVNKKFSQSSAVSLEYYLANFKRGLLCFSLNVNSGIFFRLKAYRPLLVKLHTVVLETLKIDVDLFVQSFLLNYYAYTQLS